MHRETRRRLGRVLDSLRAASLESDWEGVLALCRTGRRLLWVLHDRITLSLPELYEAREGLGGWEALAYNRLDPHKAKETV